MHNALVGGTASPFAAVGSNNQRRIAFITAFIDG
jgi:hypothetical protein